MTKWEYNLYTLPWPFNSPEIDIEVLDKLGQNGWELVAPIASGSGQTTKLLFKRPIN